MADDGEEKVAEKAKKRRRIRRSMITPEMRDVNAEPRKAESRTQVLDAEPPEFEWREGPAQTPSLLGALKKTPLAVAGKYVLTALQWTAE